jgi:integrase
MKGKLAAGLSPRTVQYHHAILRRALGQAHRWGLVSRNVAKLVDPPRVRRPEIRPLTPEQARTLLEAARGDRLEALYTVALAVGLRQGEALGLRWDDIDLDRGWLTVRNALQRLGPGWQLVEPKTARCRRTIALPSVVAAALQSHRTRQLQERLWAGARWQENDFVFASRIGTPLDGTNVTRRFQQLLRRSGLPRQRFHDLRHACASLLLAQGVHPRVVMETLGHSQVGLTMNTYSHVIPALQREAATQMDAVLRAIG